MDANLDHIIIRNADDANELGIHWKADVTWDFPTEVDALMTLQYLGEELETAREQVRQIMRYMHGAVRAARHNGEGDTKPQAIISHSGLARQTVYNMLGETE